MDSCLTDTGKTDGSQFQVLSHDAGHLWSTAFGLTGNPHLSVLHILSYVFIGGGFMLLGAAWPHLLAAQKQGRLATLGPYSRIRHPQYAGFISILFGFLLQWPTILTLVMFPFLVFMYVHLAHTEEAEGRKNFGDLYDRYAARVPAWIPRIGTPRDDPGVT